MKLKVRVVAVGVMLVWILLLAISLPASTPELTLQRDIAASLDRLGVVWTEDDVPFQPDYHRDQAEPSTTEHGELSDCRIPTDIRQTCIDPSFSPPPCPLAELAKDCAMLKSVHGYDKPLVQEELSFPLAFGLKMHTAPEQAEQLLRAIYRPHNVYCIHVDLKANQSVYDVMQSIAACFPNVHLTERVNFTYGSYDSLITEQIAVNCALKSKIDFKYYLNLAGQEFPLRTNLEMVRILRQLNGTNDIDSYTMEERYRGRLTHRFEVVDGEVKNTTLPKDPPPFQLEIRKGSQYSAFSRDFLQAVLQDAATQRVMAYFRDTLYPEENVWATINQLPWLPGGYPLQVAHNPDNQHVSRAIAWEFFDEHQCRGEYVREVCIFTRGDLPWLLSQPNLFANKFLPDKDPRSAACLEAVLDQRARARRVVLDQDYYSRLPHFRYRNTRLAGVN